MVLLELALVAANPWVDPAPTGRWAAPTSQLASELLPSDMARDVVSHVVTRPIVQGGEPFSVEFSGRPRSSEGGFCERYRYYVSVGQLVKSGPDLSPVRSTQIRVGDCPRDPDAIFANLNASDLAHAKQAIRWVQWAQNVARLTMPLPFRVSCQTETGPDRCGDGGRQALANLPLDKVFIVMPQRQSPPHHWELAVTESEPGQLLWDVAIDATPGKSSIDLTWKIPPPF